MFNFNRLNENIDKSYESAKAVYAELGVDTDSVLKKMNETSISIHCWQGDDVSGFEQGTNGISGGGILATGNYPGKARNGEELRCDLDKALSLIPGKHRINLHAIYAETDGKVVERDEINFDHFRNWINWAKERGLGIDFNPTIFSHPKAASGYTLSSDNEEIRSFWVRHTKACRKIAAEIGKELGTPCVNNIWIPDGSKDIPADRLKYRRILMQSLDEIFEDKYDKKCLLDAVECKLFGIGSESYVVGSHEFYMGYGISRDIMVCLDAGHFHPTEGIADKVSSLLLFSKNLLVHASRGVRWDSDHVVILSDDLIALAQEIKRCDAFDKVHFALDFFDASINRITAWVTGSRAALKAILISQLEPAELIKAEEQKGNLGNRLALMEEIKMLPFSAVWNKYCADYGIPAGPQWLEDVKDYEEKVLNKRG